MRSPSAARKKTAAHKKTSARKRPAAAPKAAKKTKAASKKKAASKTKAASKKKAASKTKAASKKKAAKKTKAASKKKAAKKTKAVSKKKTAKTTKAASKKKTAKKTKAASKKKAAKKTKAASKKKTAKKTKATSKKEAAGAVAPLRILVVDDEPEILELVSPFLRAFGHEVEEAQDGDAALEKILTDRPDLVLLDVMMPGLSGWEICRYVRERKELDAVRIVMATGMGEEMNAATSPLYGADTYLDKPFDLRELERAIGNVARQFNLGPNTAAGRA